MASARLLGQLLAIDFDRRYYAICDGAPAAADRSPFRRADWARALAATGRTFRFLGQKCFQHAVESPRGPIEMRLAHLHSSVEGAHLGVAGEGAPWHVLARLVAERRAPGAGRAPAYPRPGYGDERQLRAIVAAYVELFDRVCAGG